MKKLVIIINKHISQINGYDKLKYVLDTDECSMNKSF